MDSQRTGLKKGDIIENYKLVKKLGGGQFAHVWKVENVDSFYALKVHNPDKERTVYFHRERDVFTRIAELGDHPNLVKYHKLVTGGGINALLFDYSELTLNDIVNEWLSIDMVKKIARQLFSALDHLHSNGIIHTDVKVANILVKKYDKEAGDVEIVLADLGSATPEDSLITLSVGTIMFSSPEVVLHRPFTTKTDIWSACAVLFELLTTDRLFDINNEYGITYADGFTEYNEAKEEATTETGSTGSTASTTGSTTAASTDSSCSDEVFFTSDEEEDEDEEDDDRKRFFYIAQRLFGNVPDYMESDLINFKVESHIDLLTLIRLNYNFKHSEAKQMSEFLLQGLKYNPDERLSAKQMLDSDWLKD